MKPANPAAPPLATILSRNVGCFGFFKNALKVEII